jgi:leucyl/phenylalanyl-tRNA--protein transferase
MWGEERMSLTPELLMAAYAQGVFPMAQGDGRIYWYSPDPRAILPLDQLHTSRSLLRLLRQQKYEIRFDSAFADVIAACAAPGPGREQTWISGEIIRAYTQLHELGFAHSVEAWEAGELVGGLYGVSLRGLFAGESMFSRRQDASKAALFHLVRRLRDRGFHLLDVQFLTPHLKRLGAIEISQRRYQQLLKKALTVEAHFN